MLTTMKAHIRNEIADALDRCGEAHPIAVAKAVRANYPGFGEEAEHYAEMWCRKLAQRELRGMSAPTKQDSFAGMAVPRVFTVSDGEGGFRYRSLRVATVADYLSHVEIRRRHASDAQRAYLVDQTNVDALVDTDGVTDETLVTEAIEMQAFSVADGAVVARWADEDRAS